MKPDIQEIKDFLDFVKSHIPFDSYKRMNQRLLENYIQEPFRILDGLRDLGALEKDLTKEEDYWCRLNNELFSITAQNLLDYVFNKKAIEKGVDRVTISRNIPNKSPKSVDDILPVEQPKKPKLFCVFFEDFSKVEYFDDELQATKFLSDSNKNAFMAQVLKKASVKITIENV